MEVESVIPDVRVQLSYASERNVFKKRFYEVEKALLRQPVALRLAKAQKRLKSKGYGLVIWDAYRPQSVQWAMWKIKPSTKYLAHPAKGSKHSRGAAVDLTMFSLKTGRPVAMPTPHDEFSPRAHRGATKGVSAAAQRHARILREAMVAAGFYSNKYEWWHFTSTDWRNYPLSDAPIR